MPAPDWIVQRPFAHRGLHDAAKPENSLAAIDAALRADFPVEIDVQVTADRQVIVFHDWNLRRLTGRDAPVARQSAADLAALRLAGTGERIPTLDAALDLIAGRQPILIEIKNRRQPTALEPELARILGAYPGPFAIQSFNPFSLGWFRLRFPHFPRGQISCIFDTDDMAGWKKAVLANYGMNWMSRPHFISHHWKNLPSVSATILRRLFRIPLLAWTIRNPEELAVAKRLAHNVIFERFVPAQDARRLD